MSFASQENAGVGERERMGLVAGVSMCGRERAGTWRSVARRGRGAARLLSRGRGGCGPCGRSGECGGRGSRRLKGRLEVLPGALEGGPGVLGTLLKELGTVSPLVPPSRAAGREEEVGRGLGDSPERRLGAAAALRVEGGSAGFS